MTHQIWILPSLPCIQCIWKVFRPLHFLQRCLIGFKSRLWLSHKRTFRDLYPKPLLRCLDYALMVVVLLEGEPPARSERSRSRFSSTITLYFAPFIFTLILTSLPVPTAEKHPHSMMLPPPCFTVGMVPGFLQKWRFAFRTKSSILVSSHQKILASV